jgi:uncharacterized MAPEG superfamily protein
MILLDSPAPRLYALASSALVLILFWLAFRTGSVRMRGATVVNPEDVRVYRGAAVGATEHPDVQRIKRAHLNAIENMVPFFVVGLLFALTNPPVWAAAALFGAFVALRVLHVVFYLSARQPGRAATFGLGVAILLLMLAAVVRSVI